MRTRLPVKLKLAVVTAALTFGILCLFAVVIGAVAEQRIRAGFDDDLRATVADLVNRVDPQRRRRDRDNQEPLVGREWAMPRCACSTATGRSLSPRASRRWVGSKGSRTSPTIRVVSRALTVSRDESGEPFGPLVDENRGRGRRLRSVRKTAQQRRPHGQPRAHLPRLRSARRDAARVHRRPVRRPARHAADRRAHARRPRGGAHARPGRDACQSRRQTTRCPTSRTPSRTCSGS